jgi:hypothetical protein
VAFNWLLVDLTPLAPAATLSLAVVNLALLFDFLLQLLRISVLLVSRGQSHSLSYESMAICRGQHGQRPNQKATVFCRMVGCGACSPSIPLGG